MRKILYICDRCKGEIDADPVKIIAEIVDRATEDFAYADPYPELKELDLCKECGDFIVGQIKRFCSKGAPARINREFERAVEEMVQGSDPPPDRGETQAQTRHRKDPGPAERRMVSEGHCGGDELFRADCLQCSEKAGCRQEESSEA